MSEETKKQETMEDFMEEINASFSNFRDDDMLIWDKLVQMQEDKTEFEVTVEGIVKGGVIAMWKVSGLLFRFPSWLCTM